MNSRKKKDAPKEFMALLLSVNVEVPQKGREMRVVMGRPSHPLGDKRAG